jgi:exodeoxyribonuclease V beta subunit
MNDLYRNAAADVGATLDVLRFPLHGSRLIEASAGTGKTFTIATLYVRLVLGHGGEHACARTLAPPEILVVTFTEAATQELRDRIRVRLAQAAAAFLEDPDDVQPSSPGADPLHDLRAEYEPREWAGCARKLQLAVEWMDEAAVSTIHGWCNRMLREHAFDSNSLFQQTLEKSAGHLMAEVVRDYWRTFIAPLDADSAADVRAWWKSPDDLHAQLAHILKFASELKTPDDPRVVLCGARERRHEILGELKAPWAQWLPEVRQLLDDAVAKKQVDGRKLQAGRYGGWLDILAAWSGDAVVLVPALSDAAWNRLSPAGLEEAWKGEPPAHPAFAALAQLREHCAAMPNARNDVLCHATAWVSSRFAQEQAQRAQMGFDDLLGHLDAALAGPNGTALAATIRAQFPVALIDEFQDTDPVQYRIFDAVYRLAQNDKDSALILIGDPKQAIYGFRGADIYTYLRARAAVGGRLYVLKKNFRSTQAMVNATNHCFNVAEQDVQGAGAFLFRRADENPVPFVPALAQGRADHLQVEGGEVAALTAWWLPANEEGKAMTAGAYRDGMADACAGEIVRLLTLGQQGQAGFAGTAEMRALRPADMAVLVNSGRQAKSIRQALSRRGVRSVYLSENQSVFNSPIAGEIEYWLKACAEPDDGRLLRAALATPTLGLSWTELDLLGHDELAWESRVQQFVDYGKCWRDKGVLPMLRRLLDDFSVPARRLSGAAGQDENTDGERVMTDMLHIAELLQQASVQIEGEHALVRYLAEMRRAAEQGDENDALTIRLESDADLVRVITVHKSKGLEYPLVFLPYAVAFRPIGADDVPMTWHDDDGDLKVALRADPAIHAMADRERLGEDLRKLYVALTRARYATWVGVAPVANVHASAFGYLMGRGLSLDGQPLESVLQEWRQGNPHIDVQRAPEPPAYRYVPQAAQRQAGGPRTMSRPVRENWWIASYSSLRTVQVETPDTAQEDNFLEALDHGGLDHADGVAGAASNSAPTTRPGSATGMLHDIPGGAEVGTFFHELLEWAAAQGFSKLTHQRETVRDAVARRCNVRGWDNWIDPLTDWMLAFAEMPLRLPPLPSSLEPPLESSLEPQSGVRSRARSNAKSHKKSGAKSDAESEVPTDAQRQQQAAQLSLYPDGMVAPVALAGLASYVSEMEFWIAAHKVDVVRLDRLVRAHTLENAARPALEAAQMNGMLKGFIDLVFEHEGRYYVVDYKSNRLGSDDAAYTTQAMRGVILQSRYELQYTLYLFALHRLLKSRLPGYDYDQHIGGAAYVFLRGTQGEAGGVFADRPPRVLIEALDRMFAGDTGQEAA